MSEEYVTVSALTKYIKYKFDKDPHLGRVYLTGEISNFRLRPTHQYFSLMPLFLQQCSNLPLKKFNFVLKKG